jgi:exonuclease III
MNLKIITLNIEGRKHLDKVIPFLKKEKPDVICLQEVFKKDLNLFKKELNIKGKFFPMSDRSKINKHYNQFFGVWGIIILTNLKNTGFKKFYYVGKGNTPQFKNNFSDDRVLGYVKVTKNLKVYNIGTTHFYFTPDGQADQEQRKATKKLLTYLKKYNDFILLGDFNAPRGREIYSEFNKYFKDNLSKNVTSTIDKKYHKVKTLKLVVDTIFSKGNYKVKKVYLKDGLSDHKAIIAVVEKK